LPMPPPPPLLLTKRVTAFLRANLSPCIQAAMLTTPAGNLLAHASSLPASALRRQCAVAASIWALQTSSSSQPQSQSQSQSQSSSSTSPPPAPAPLAPPPTSSSNHHDPSTTKTRKHKSTPALTVQLDSGLVFVIRRLKCGMLFICMGGQSQAQSQAQSQPQQQQPHNRRTRTTPIGSPSANSELGRASVMSVGTTSGQTITSQASTSTTTTTSAGVVVMRRQVEELARWLDEKLGGLCVPDEGIGIGI
ncbi:hypothetical protein B0T21DRAFT_261758, partial [Apiosordaria backusii]